MSKANKLGRITMAGQITEYPIPTPNSSQPYQGFVGAGPDGAIWFTENAEGVDQLGRLTMDGKFSEYRLPTPNSFVAAVMPGPDGAMWFTEAAGNKVGRITPDGKITEYPVPTANARPLGIVAGPDGALWFTERPGPINKIGRITMDGTITEYPVPTENAGLLRIAAGPDRALWFAEYNTNKLGRIATNGRISEYQIPSAAPLDTPAGQIMTSGPVHLAAGPDGAVWFTEFNSNQLGRLTPDGQFSEYPVPTAKSNPYHPILAPDGAIWFTEIAGNKIGRAASAATPGLPNTGRGSSQIHPPLPTALLTAAWLVAALAALASRTAPRRRRGG
jgi:virginiamycin B lyase